MTSRVDFQANTDEHINLDSRNFCASKCCKDHLFKQFTVCHYTLTILKKKMTTRVCEKREAWNKKPCRRLNKLVPSGMKQWEPKKLNITEREVEECYSLN